MDIESFNKTLSWLDEAILSKFNEANFDILLKFSSGTGGPGENVTAYLEFKSVCYISIPMVMQFSDSPQIKLCSPEKAKSIIPIQDLDDGYQEEIENGIMKVIQIADGKKELNHFVACYEYKMTQSPSDWHWDE